MHSYNKGHVYPTKTYVHISASTFMAPYLKFFLHWCKFIIIMKQIDAGTASFYGTILTNILSNISTKSPKNHHINPNLHVFGANKVQSLYTFLLGIVNSINLLLRASFV